jgi:Immunoglobulin domain
VVAAGAAPLHADAIAVTAGRAAWSDNSTDAHPVRSRSLTTSGDTLQLGSTNELAATTSDPSDIPVQVSGPNTLFTTDGPTTARGGRTTVIHVRTNAGQQEVTVGETELPNAWLSGNRVLYTRFTASGAIQLVLFDVLSDHGAVLDLPGIDTSSPSVTLWGDYVAYTKADGSVWRRSLTTGAATEVAPAGSGQTGGVKEWGDEVAWVSGSENGRSVWSWRDAAASSSSTSTGSLLSLTSDGALLNGDPDEDPFDGPVLLQPYGAATAQQILPDAVFSAVGLDASALAWVDGPHQQPFVMALPHTADRPRSLGALAAPTLPDQNLDWTLQLPASAALTSCQVTISSGTATVKTLACDSGEMSQGVATVTWSGLAGSNGTTVRPGAYTWTLHASNADGALLSPSGGAGTFTGTVFSPTGPVITTFPKNMTAIAGKLVSFRAAATGVPAPTASWAVSHDGGAHWTTLAGQTSPTLTFRATPSQNGNRYRVRFNNGMTIAEAFADLTVRFGPHVTTSPKSQRATLHKPVTFTARATGNPTPSARWQVKTSRRGSWRSITGANTTRLRLRAKRSLDGNRYRCVFTNAVGHVATKAATLHVRH